MRRTLEIRGGRVIDPANRLDTVTDVYIVGSKIAGIGTPPEGFKSKNVIEAGGKIVCPGFVDLAARLREPGLEHKGSIASETRAAAASGITTLCVPPDTNPVIDAPPEVALIRRLAKRAGYAWVVSLGALTRGLDGELLSDMGILKDAGVVGVSNAMRPIKSTMVLRRAMEYAATFKLPIHVYPLEPWLSELGSVHEGVVSTRLGLPGIPEAAETTEIARLLTLAEHTGCRVHFCRLSTRKGVKMIARAKADGLRVSADVAAHQLHLTETDVDGFNTYAHVMPPLRTTQDRDGLKEGVADGTISCICSDHQPHEVDAKLRPFMQTEPGISGLETLLPLTLSLVESGVLNMSQAISRLTAGPAQVLGTGVGSLDIGAVADVCVFDPEMDWQLTPDAMLSRGHNTPFMGLELRGRVCHTVHEGRISFTRQPIQDQD